MGCSSVSDRQLTPIEKPESKQNILLIWRIGSELFQSRKNSNYKPLLLNRTKTLEKPVFQIATLNHDGFPSHIAVENWAKH